jgi:hypothetical protein
MTTMTRASLSTRSFAVRAAAAACLIGPALGLGGCNKAQEGALLGAGIGAMAGHAIGHDAGSTVAGAAVGAGAGYIIGSESDRARHHDRGHGGHGCGRH